MPVIRMDYPESKKEQELNVCGGLVDVYKRLAFDVANTTSK